MQALDPSAPATMADLMNAIAEVNTRTTAVLDIPDWLTIALGVLAIVSIMAMAAFGIYWLWRLITER